MAETVRCSSCHRALGTSVGVRAGIVCTRQVCQYITQPKLSRFEDRDRIIDSLDRAIVPRDRIADAVGVSTQRIGQILATRRRTS